jgi:1-deoxy-D-xylulose-5-phosphate synthase
MRALDVADELGRDGWSVGVVNARWAKPLDRDLILDVARRTRLVVTLEESVATGGFGSAVLGVIEEARLTEPALRDVPVRLIGIPAGSFVDHGSVVDLRRVTRLDVEGIAGQVRETIGALGLVPRERDVGEAVGAG